MRVQHPDTRLDPTGRSIGHVPGLDGLRGIAVLLVLGLHAGLLIHPAEGGLLPGGFIGVDIFFVLSGFLITSLLVRERADTGRIAFARFYSRRAWRLLPALLLLLVFHIAYSAWADIPWTLEAKTVVAIVLYVSNWAQSYGLDVPGGLVHTWTLAIEEQFYLVWPAAVLLLVRRLPSRRSMLVVLVAGVLASALVRAWIWEFGAGYPAAYMRTDARADGLLIGAICAFLWRWDMVPRRGLGVAASVSAASLAVLAFIWPSSSPAMFLGGYTVVSVATGIVILAILEGRWTMARALCVEPLRGVGRVSYGLYLWQGLSLQVAARQLSEHRPIVQAAVGVACASAATLLSWRLLEQPCLRYRDRRQEGSARLVGPRVPTEPVG